MKTQFMFVFTNSTIKLEHAEIIVKKCMIYLQCFKAINVKILEHHEANPGFNSGSPVESPSCKHVFFRVETVLTLDGVATNHVVEV